MNIQPRYRVMYIFLCTSTLYLIWFVTQRGDMKAHVLDIRGVPLESTDAQNLTPTGLGRTSDTDMFKHALVAGKRRPTRGFLTLGIPTVKRPKDASYLKATIEDLLRNANEEEKRELTLVIFLADFDKAARDEIKADIINKFNSHIEDGLIQVIEAPRMFYPSLDNLPKTAYKHSPTKVRWISKQNYDYAFLMLYSKDLSEYYLQLEDDLSTIPNYITEIRKFIQRYQKSQWTCLEFSALGFIAKLYRSRDLYKLAKMMMLFFYEQPNDVTYLIFNQLMQQPHRIVRKPTIFKHMGLHSSLPEKLEQRVDPLFLQDNNGNRTNKVKTVLNPPAKVSTNLRIYEDHRLEHCYGKKGPLWTFGPRKGATISIVFNQPQRLLSVTVLSGPDDHPDDFLQNAVLRIGQKFSVTCTDIYAVQIFKFGQADLELDKEAQDIPASCIQIQTLAGQNNWLMISDISVRAVES
ncbi:alpha-1,6-mannosyl-glycoprotein 4-beta-N-acetylglucosaminyltransferase-like [Liolophura sinensis]|uniref:alpha-1,6-mannosyl-glycoprotein 4-beta-N-acetylglucosaminyltransferase-like n=1 Tax=Liolophura sinensis TaxID=3198878 RepID=UPI0031595319